MHGAAAIEKVRKQQPAAYVKICALLVPREMKLEHSGGVKAMSDEEGGPGGEMGWPVFGLPPFGKNASSTREIDAAFVSLLQKRADALIVSPNPLFDSRRVQLVTLATHHRLLTAYPFRENVERLC